MTRRVSFDKAQRISFETSDVSSSARNPDSPAGAEMSLQSVHERNLQEAGQRENQIRAIVDTEFADVEINSSSDTPSRDEASDVDDAPGDQDSTSSLESEETFALCLRRTAIAPIAIASTLAIGAGITGLVLALMVGPAIGLPVILAMPAIIFLGCAYEQRRNLLED